MRPVCPSLALGFLRDPRSLQWEGVFRTAKLPSKARICTLLPFLSFSDENMPLLSFPDLFSSFCTLRCTEDALFGGASVTRPRREQSLEVADARRDETEKERDRERERKGKSRDEVTYSRGSWVGILKTLTPILR